MLISMYLPYSEDFDILVLYREKCFFFHFWIVFTSAHCDILINGLRSAVCKYQFCNEVKSKCQADPDREMIYIC